MKKFMFLHVGFKTPTQEIMNDWHKWFESISDKTVDSGFGFGAAREINRDGSKELPLGLDSMTGYTITLVSVIFDHPLSISGAMGGA